MGQRPIDEIVGERLQALRTSRGVSVDQLGAVLGTTGSQVTSYEAGTTRIPAAHLIEICKFFHVKLEDFFPRAGPDQDPVQS